MKILSFLTKRYLFISALTLINLIFIFGCIDPYKVEVGEGLQLLTVDGMITSGPGPHKIKLTRSATYGSVFEGLTRPEAGATVIIRDEVGKVIFLEEDFEKRGEYLTPANFNAAIGSVYTLQIQLANGKIYSSLPEKVNTIVPIESFYIQAEEIPVEGELLKDSGAGIYVDFKDPSDENNYYFWRNDPVTYELNTRPDLYYERFSLIPAPKACCYTCYLEEEIGNNEIFLTNDEFFNGLNTRYKAAFILDDGLRFISTLRLDLKQLSISAEAYRFLKLVKQQIELTGSVFDPPPANIRGNIISLDNPDEVVLGYFMAAGEYKQRIYINRGDLEFRQPDFTIADDCRVVDGATTEKPADWNP